MARQKTVFTNDQITLEFVSQSQAYGRTSNSSMYFEGNKMFSYGSHFIMGIIVGSTLLISPRDSSVTTNKHLGNLYQTAKTFGLSVIEVPDVTANCDDSHKRNIDAMSTQYREYNQKSERARKDWSKESWFKQAQEKYQDILTYAKHVEGRLFS